MNTCMVPRRKERRFLQTGSRMSMQLKFRQAAGALAQGKACCGEYKKTVCYNKKFSNSLPSPVTYNSSPVGGEKSFI